MNNIKGSFIPGVLLELLILAITGSMAVSLLHRITKEVFYTRTSQRLENNISKTLATLYSATHRAPVVWGAQMFQWRNENEPLPGYLEEAVQKLANANCIKPDSIFLESIDTNPVILFSSRDDSSNLFRGNVQSKHISSLKDDRWVFFAISGLFRIQHKPYIRFMHENGQWEVQFQEPDTSTQILQNFMDIQPDSVKPLPVATSPLRDHVIHYINPRNELRRYSLITYDNQPVSEYISDMSKDDGNCYLTASLNSIKIKQTFPCKNNSFEPFLYYDFLDL